MLRHIRHLETLKIDGTAGFWCDGSELFGTVDLERSRLWDGQESDFYESDGESESHDEDNPDSLNVSNGINTPELEMEDITSSADLQEDTGPFSSGRSEEDDGSSSNIEPQSDPENS